MEELSEKIKKLKSLFEEFVKMPTKLDDEADYTKEADMEIDDAWAELMRHDTFSAGLIDTVSKGMIPESKYFRLFEPDLKLEKQIQSLLFKYPEYRKDLEYYLKYKRKMDEMLLLAKEILVGKGIL